MIGDKIKKMRVKKGVTQEQMANVLGVSPQAVSKWEQNITIPDVSMLVPIADYFAISVDYLLREQNRNVSVNFEKYVEVVSKKDRIVWRCTVKNISGREIEQIKLKTYFYDKDGNSIDYRDNLIFDLEPNMVKPNMLYSTVGAKAASVNIVVKYVKFADEHQ